MSWCVGDRVARPAPLHAAEPLLYTALLLLSRTAPPATASLAYRLRAGVISILTYFIPILTYLVPIPILLFFA
jgi:hypothetical protein